MHEFSKPEMTPSADHGDLWRIYRGNSMFRVFSNGDLLIAEPIAAEAATPGDIICFKNPQGVHTVHRVIRKNASGGLVTMGDNNASPDSGSIPPGTAILRVTSAKTVGGNTVIVSGGRRGMRDFRRNRMRRLMAKISSKAAGAVRRIMVFKITLTEHVRFGDAEAFYFHGRFVANRDGRGRTNWISPWARAFFRIDK